MAADLKKIYGAATVLEAERALESFAQAWDEKYPTIAKMWRAKWTDIVTLFDFPPRKRIRLQFAVLTKTKEPAIDLHEVCRRIASGSNALSGSSIECGRPSTRRSSIQHHRRCSVPDARSGSSVEVGSVNRSGCAGNGEKSFIVHFKLHRGARDANGACLPNLKLRPDRSQAQPAPNDVAFARIVMDWQSQCKRSKLPRRRRRFRLGLKRNP